MKLNTFYESAEESISYFEAFITSVYYLFIIEQCQYLCHDASQKFNSLIQNHSNPFNLTSYNKYKEGNDGDIMNNYDLLILYYNNNKRLYNNYNVYSL